MTDRYWVGGTDTWDATAGMKWAATSGGAGGETVPTAGDNVYFDGNSGAGTVTVSATANCASLDFIGFAGELAGNSYIHVNGDLTYGSGMTMSHTGTIYLDASGTITTNGIIRRGTSRMDNLGQAIDLADDVVMTDESTSAGGYFYINGGTLNANGHDIFGTAFQVVDASAVVNLSGSTVTVTNAGNTIYISSGTINGVTPSNPIVVSDLRGLFSGVPYVAVSGCSSTLCIRIDAPHVAITSIGTGTAVTIIANGTGPRMIQIGITDGSTTIRPTDIQLSGNSLDDMTLVFSGNAVASSTINIASGTFSWEHVAMHNITCTGGATFSATNSIDLGRNSGINISPPGMSPSVTRAWASFAA